MVFAMGLAAISVSCSHTELQKVSRLGLSNLPQPIPTHYSLGARTRAEWLQTDLRQMNAFFQEHLGVQTDVALAVLNPADWKKTYNAPYGLPGILGKPRVIFMPAHSGGAAFRQMMARRDAIPAQELQSYLEDKHQAFEATADDFVDIIAFHELGHALSYAYGIRPRCHWLSEFAASYFAYAFLSERKPELIRVFDLLGRPSGMRPPNATLAHFERVHDKTVDTGWYQGMFERHIRELYPRLGLEFLRELKRHFPAGPDAKIGASASASVQKKAKKRSIPPEQALEKLEVIAPGFQSWGGAFH